MKRLVITALMAVGLLSVPGWAEENRLTAEVPFAFRAGDVWMMPGEYTVAPLSQSAYLVRTPDARETAFFLIQRTGFQKAQDRAYLVFNKYEGERYFLAQIWRPGENHGVQLMKSRREQEIVTSVLHAEARVPEQVIIVARLVR